MKKCVVFCILGLLSLSLHADIWNDELIPGGSQELDSFPIPKVKFSRTGKSRLTHNRMGFDTTQAKVNWLIEAFIESVKLQDRSDAWFLEVGCGYGNIVRTFLAESAQAKIVANDLAREHLLLTREATSNADRSRVFLNSSSFQNAKLDNMQFQGIMMHRVLHFFSGDEVLKALENAHRLLAKGGRLYLATNTPYNKDYSSWFLPQFEANLESGMAWPGEKLLVRKALPKQVYGLPDYLHVMDARVLHPALERIGFRVVKSDFISMKRFQTDTSRDGREVIGIIAEKESATR